MYVTFGAIVAIIVATTVINVPKMDTILHPYRLTRNAATGPLQRQSPKSDDPIHDTFQMERVQCYLLIKRQLKAAFAMYMKSLHRLKERSRLELEELICYLTFR